MKDLINMVLDVRKMEVGGNQVETPSLSIQLMDKGDWCRFYGRGSCPGSANRLSARRQHKRGGI